MSASVRAAQLLEPVNFFVLAALYGVAFLTVMLAVLTSVDTIAGEIASGTIQTIVTKPLRRWEVVIGKWLGAWFFGLALVATTVVFPLVLLAYGNPDMGPVYSGYLGLALLVGAILAVGLLASALTGNLIVSVAIGYTFVLMIWIIGIAGDLLTAFTGQATGILSSLVTYLDFSNHFSATFGRGVIDTVDIVYYVSVITIALFLATRVVEARRWR